MVCKGQREPVAMQGVEEGLGEGKWVDWALKWCLILRLFPKVPGQGAESLLCPGNSQRSLQTLGTCSSGGSFSVPGVKQG